MMQHPSAFASTFYAEPPLHKRIPAPSARYRKLTTSPLKQFTTSTSEFEKDYSQFSGDENESQDANARSDFGTKTYWDAMYQGMGDFDADEYSWYYGFEVIKPLLQEYIVGKDGDDLSAKEKADLSILIPGCGNDPLVLDLYTAGYTTLSAFDYSSGAIDRQTELLEYLPMGSNLDNVKLSVQDARELPQAWEKSFDVIIEKG